MKKHCINSLFYNLEQTSRLCRAFCENYFEENAPGHVSFNEFIILDTIICFPDICQRDLARLIMKGASHTSKLLAELEHKELITRPAGTKQNRVIRRIVITEKGFAEHKYAEKIALEFAQNIENAIGTQKALECNKILNTIRETINGSVEIDFE